MKQSFKKILHIILATSVIASFVFAPPSTIVKDALVSIAISEIQKSNTVAFAQEDIIVPIAEESPVCCDPRALNDASGSVSSGNFDSSSGFPYVCGGTCYYDEDDTWGGGTTEVCCDPAANNDGSGSLGSTDTQGRTVVCGGTCDYDEVIVNICCDPLRGGRAPLAGEQCGSDEWYCEDTPAPQVCCDGNWDNYVDPSERPEPHDCEYQPPTCSCIQSDDPFFNDPFYTSSRSNTSNCGAGDTTVVVPPGDGDEGGVASCEINTTFSVTKSQIEISGTARMLVSASAIDSSLSTTTASACNAFLNDEAFLAGRAAEDATPDTPLNSTIALDAFSSYVVTSKDYCPEIDGIQNSFSECVESPSCGDAMLYSAESFPSSGLCSVGTAENMETTDESYSWTCNTADSQTSCTTARTCSGTSCVSQDLCINDEYPGVQDSAFLSTNNLYSDSAGYCWNNVSGACGNASQVNAPTGGPDTNLCTYPTTLGSGPTRNTGVSPSPWEWTCNDVNGNQLSAPATCQASACEETSGGCNTTVSSTTLIKSFTARPTIVSSSADTCTLNWTTEGVNSSITEPSQGCLLNNQSVSEQGSTNVLPGSYSLMCYVGEQFETKTTRCSVKPSFKEI